MALEELMSLLSDASPSQPVQLGRYQIHGLLGAGGMGAVYDAHDEEHGTRVALKTLTSLDPASLLRFKNEFRSVADLSHPNLVSLYELKRHENLWYFTMDHIDGVDFVEWLRGHEVAMPLEPTPTVAGSKRAAKRERVRPRDDRELGPKAPASLPRLRDALSQLIAGVQALHEAGFLHLDIKPSNVLVDRKGRVFLVDFGLIQPIDAPRAAESGDPQSISITGTPMWMAPEQCAGGPVGKPADWYAVGLMLYSSLTGRPAFGPTSFRTVAAASTRGLPTPPIELVPDLPVDLSELAMALLNPKPEQRPVGRTLIELTGGAEALATVQQETFVGRQAELERLQSAYAEVEQGSARIIHISGSSGLGKSALLRRYLRNLRSEGSALVLDSRCYERETVPYKAFDGLLDQLSKILASGELGVSLPEHLADLVAVFPVLAGVPRIIAELKKTRGRTQVGEVELKRRAVRALCELFEKLAAQQPLVLHIDDLQWADTDSVTLLERLLHGSKLERALVLLSFRPQEARANALVGPFLDLDELDPRQGSIALTPLPPKDAGTLATQQLTALGVEWGELADTIAQESAGVPFFVEELAYFAAQDRDEKSERVLASGISLDEVLAQRVKSLPGDQRELLEILSVANSPIPIRIAFAGAQLASEALRSLWALSGRHLIRVTGSGAQDLVELHHDRMRESVLRYLSPERTAELHLRLARAMSGSGEEAESADWLFDAVRHYNAAHALLEGEERALATRLNLDAARRARKAAAFPLAFDCFRAGAELLGEEAWEEQYELAFALHAGAAETAYFRTAWDELDAYVEIVKTRGRSIFDQLVGWEVHIDACIQRKEFDEAIATAIQALELLGTDLPARPSEAEVGAAVQAAMESLASVDPEGLLELKDASDPRIVATVRIMSSISSAAYFAAPPLLVVLACRQVVSSIEHGLASVTAYALSVFGIVLNTLGLHDQAHTWGQVALELLGRYDDLRLDARTRHVIHNLVCVWTVPLSSTLPLSRDVVERCKSIGDMEYAGYASHNHVVNALYAGKKLPLLYEDAKGLGDVMRAHEQVNALHVHEPFEALIRCYMGMTDEPGSLDGHGFSEVAAMDTARDSGSSAGVAAVHTVMGLARYTFGKIEEAHQCFTTVRTMLDAIPSVWHVPIIHQFAALSIYGLPAAKQEAFANEAEASIAALRHLASHCPENFAHRVALVEAERARVHGREAEALAGFESAIVLAEAESWLSDLALAHELASRCSSGEEQVRHANAARVAWQRWGAAGKFQVS